MAIKWLFKFPPHLMSAPALPGETTTTTLTSATQPSMALQPVTVTFGYIGDACWAKLLEPQHWASVNTLSDTKVRWDNVNYVQIPANDNMLIAVLEVDVIDESVSASDCWEDCLALSPIHDHKDSTDSCNHRNFKQSHTLLKKVDKTGLQKLTNNHS